MYSILTSVSLDVTVRNTAGLGARLAVPSLLADTRRGDSPAFSRQGLTVTVLRTRVLTQLYVTGTSSEALVALTRIVIFCIALPVTVAVKSADTDITGFSFPF